MALSWGCDFAGGETRFRERQSQELSPGWWIRLCALEVDCVRWKWILNGLEVWYGHSSVLNTLGVTYAEPGRRTPSAVDCTGAGQLRLPTWPSYYLKHWSGV
ncbi:MAG: hypothetical protein R6U98_27175, partial [Pirellulaceae bacterium]